MKNYEEISESLEHTISLLDPELIKKIKSKFSNYNFFPIHLAKPKVVTNGINFDSTDSVNFSGVLPPLIWMLHKLNYLG